MTIFLMTAICANIGVRAHLDAYDLLGNIQNKSDLGAYTYAKAHQVKSAGGITYNYDDNGNVIEKIKDNKTINITYSSYNKPIKIKDDTNTTEFFYAPNRARYKKVLNGNSTYYVGKLYEQENTQGVIKYKNFIYANNQLIALHIEEDDGKMILPQNRYMHKDALGSIDTITNESGQVIKRMTYKPFGQQVAQEWINEASKGVVTKRGFTGHEHITEFNLIHMNGRIYDPVTGRFLSADPTIQAPYDTQSYNRYTYVKNNPLKYTDPSGYSWWHKVTHAIGKVFHAIKKAIVAIVAIVVVVVIAIYAPYLIPIMLKGAAWGFAIGYATTGDVHAALKGAMWGALSAGIAFGIGELASSLTSQLGPVGGFIAKGVLHGITRAAISKAQGGRWSTGFWSGFAGSTLAPVSNMASGYESKVIINAAISGTTSKIAGGKFVNGAVTGAFIMMYNDLEHEYKEQNLDWDLNGDGKMSVSESHNWWRNGNGKPVDLDASKLTALKLGDRTIILGIDYFVHGQVPLAPNGGIYYSPYDFDIKVGENLGYYGDGWLGFRNYGTIVGGIAAGKGKSFTIRYYNKPKLIKVW